mgnify:CR=1 FL=1
MKKILLADDSAIVRNLLKTTLVPYYELIEAKDGKQAVELAGIHAIDLFLLDLNMPIMDGLDATRQIRTIPKYVKTPILMLTSEIKDDKKQEGKEAGATGWVSKTVDQKDFLSAINSLLK